MWAIHILFSNINVLIPGAASKACSKVQDQISSIQILLRHFMASLTAYPVPSHTPSPIISNSHHTYNTQNKRELMSHKRTNNLHYINFLYHPPTQISDQSLSFLSKSPPQNNQIPLDAKAQSKTTKQKQSKEWISTAFKNHKVITNHLPEEITSPQQ